MHLLKAIQLLAILAVLQACATTSHDLSEMITGNWQSTVGGFNVTTSFTATEVSVDGHKPLGYQLDGNSLTIDEDETSCRTVNFPSSTEMIQVDVITGTVHRFQRSADAG